MRQDCSVMGMVPAAAEQPAGLHQLMSRFVNRRLVMMDGAHHGEAIRPLRQSREVLADLDAGCAGVNGAERPAHFGRRCRLEIERVEMAGTADEKEEDAVELA